MPAFALTIFIGAFLLFQVQPLIGKYILPWFGGGPGVWTTCMLFFQMLLLGGYAYAHLSSRWFKPRAQVLIHLSLLALALALLPITPTDSWKPHGSGNPVPRILALLAISLGAPYFVLSSTGPLMQQWFSRTNPSASPYRLYALSNAGSLLALISYPFYFETHFTRKIQAQLWGWGVVAYVFCCGVCALKLWQSGARLPELSEKPALPEVSPTIIQRMLWWLLPACASVLLLATTNKLCQDVAVIPFLWVLPLALYLLSFIICFDNARWYGRVSFSLLLIVALVAICWALFEGTRLSIARQLAIFSGGLFVCCMVCHGELYRLRPDPRRLTGFYLMIAAGGAIGGLFVAVIAPVLFTDYYELHWGLLLSGVLFLICCIRDHGSSNINQWRWLAGLLPLMVFAGLDRFIHRLAEHAHAAPRTGLIGLRIGMWIFVALMVISWIVRKKFKTFRYWHLLVCAWLFLGVMALGATLWMQGRKSDPDVVHASRNFYGVLTVYEHNKSEPGDHHFLLQHGRITHGLQFVEPSQAAWPTTYYARQSGVGVAVNALPSGPRRIGVVGLGAGTTAAYGRAGDYFHLYEINPEVKHLAATRFTYLSNCPAAIDIALGDARLSMETEPPQQFDLLALDAFSSDAIPVHLLTKEAFEVYERHMKTNGLIAVHVSNRYLDLEPVVVNLAREFDYKFATIDFEEDEEEWWLYSSTWILLSHSQNLIDSPAIREAPGRVKTHSGNVPLWTDDFASLFQILKRP